MSRFCGYLGCTPKHSTKITEGNKTGDMGHTTNL